MPRVIKGRLPPRESYTGPAGIPWSRREARAAAGASTQLTEQQRTAERREKKKREKDAHVASILAERGLPPTQQNADKIRCELKRLKREEHKRTAAKRRRQRRKRRADRYSQFFRNVIRLDSPPCVNSRRASLYAKIAQRRALTAQCELERLDCEIHEARQRLIAGLQDVGTCSRRGQELSKALNKPVKLGKFPLYLAHFPKAPRFKKPEQPEYAVFIYVLVDKNDNTVRYVGKTVNPDRRLHDHRKFNAGNMQLWKWKKKINFNYDLRVIAVVDQSVCREAERGWIRYYRSIGRIYNIGDGGD